MCVFVILDVDFGVTPGSISPAHSGSNSSLLDSNQNVNVNHDSSQQPPSKVFGAIAGSVGPAMVIQTAAGTNAPAPASGGTGIGLQTSPPSSMTASTNSLSSPEDRYENNALAAIVISLCQALNFKDVTSHL